MQWIPLVRANTPEQKWALQTHPPDHVLVMEAQGRTNTTESLLVDSNAAQVLTAAGVDTYLMTARCSPRVHQWAQQHGLTLLMTRFDLQDQLENKLWFDGFLRAHGLPVPPRMPLPLGATDWQGPVAIQEPDSLGGEGTFLVRAPDQLAQLWGQGHLQPGRPYLTRALLPGQAFGITVFVDASLTLLSAIRQQCYAPATQHLLFAGVQWATALPDPLRQQLSRIFLRLGRALREVEFRGFANVDFLLDPQQNVWILECNPRLSAATPQLARHRQTTGGFDLTERFEDVEFLSRPEAATIDEQGIAQSDFAGSTLDLAVPPSLHGYRLTRVLPSGRYTARDGHLLYLGAELRDPLALGEFQLVALAQPGDVLQAEQCVATVQATVPLYDDAGQLLPDFAALFSNVWSSDAA